jgi:hypothetical protein
LDPGLHALDGCEIADLAAREIDRVGVPVLVAPYVLLVDDVPVVVGPDVRPDAALGVAGDRARPGRIVDRSHPEVQHAVEGSREAERRAVRADPGTTLSGSAKSVCRGISPGSASGSCAACREQPRIQVLERTTIRGRGRRMDHLSLSNQG